MDAPRELYDAIFELTKPIEYSDAQRFVERLLASDVGRDLVTGWMIIRLAERGHAAVDLTEWASGKVDWGVEAPGVRIYRETLAEAVADAYHAAQEVTP